MVALIEDTNNKPGKHVAKNSFWSERGVLVCRNKLPYGDYILAPKIVVDTKNDIDELAMDIKADYARFRDAAIKAREHGSHMIILVENKLGITSLKDLESWQESPSHFKTRQRRNKNAERYMGVDIRTAKDGHLYDKGIVYKCRHMETKYGLEFDFCTPAEAGQRVLEHLGVCV